jgi:hypothetical protein
MTGRSPRGVIRAAPIHVNSSRAYACQLSAADHLDGRLQAMASTAQETASGLGSTPGFWSGKTVTMQSDGYKNGYNHKSSRANI